MVKLKVDLYKAGRIVLLYLGVVFVIVGFVVTYLLGLPLIEQAKASQNWPTTKGVVLQSMVASPRSNNSSTSYTAVVSYSYQVQGQDYECGTVRFGIEISTSDRSLAQETVKKYPVDKPVVVYYDPKNPAAAVLEPGVFKATYFFYRIGWLLMGPGILMAGIPLLRWLIRIVKGSDESQASANIAD
ncbi:DUF3592 domain-containing protein [uncultured Gimesia sp.]|uniref:DUF3592 domain-containing protein n=1 Tax=uncultured Gimesia sp. TaxID=1678688 RepID=UPI0030D6F88D|tara:strand:+ start:133147 stop:133704 length:558 start_codon:yes stop_codon:yes gene_type:complete